MIDAYTFNKMLNNSGVKEALENESKELLVIVDLQVGFMNKHTQHLAKATADFINDQWDGDVVATRYINSENTACYKFEGWTDCMAGTPEAELVPELKELETLGYIKRTFDKDKYSCWNSEFKEFVAENKYDKLVFIGVNTGCCVLHSVFDAYNDLQECEVIGSLCGSTSGEASHVIALQVLRECITKQRVR